MTDELVRKAALLAALDASIRRGIADSEAGRVIDIDELAARLDAKYRTATPSEDQEPATS